MIPTDKTCKQLWEDMGLADDLKKHLSAVANLAVKIGTELNKKGYSLNLPLIEAAALLHDIEKGTPDHAIVGAKTLAALGFTELVPIVKLHMRLPTGFQPEISELTVVFLADKLILGSQPVNLEKRYSEKLIAYHNEPFLFEKISNQLKMALKLEKQIKTVLGLDSLLLLI